MVSSLFLLANDQDKSSISIKKLRIIKLILFCFVLFAFWGKVNFVFGKKFALKLSLNQEKKVLM